jgi:peptidoglycan hydrolase CwlO-like protein
MSTSSEWQSYQDIDSSQIDAISGYMIYHLALEDLEADVSTLKQKINETADDRGRDDIRVEQTRQLNYRAEEHLIPAGLVTELEPVDDSSPGNPPCRYALTDTGIEWFKNQDFSADSVSWHLDNLQSRVNSVEENLDDIEQDVNNLGDTVADNSRNIGGLTTAKDTHSDDIDEISGDIFDLERDIDDIEDSIDSVNGDVQDLSANHADLEDQVSALDESVSEIKNRLVTLNNVVDGFESRVEDIERDVTSLFERLDELADRVGENTDTATQATTETAQNSRKITRLKWIITVQSSVLLLVIAFGALVSLGLV